MHETIKTARLRSSWRPLMLAAFAAFALGGASPALAQQQAQMTIQGYGSTPVFDLELNKSIIVDLPVDVGEVIVSQPQVAGTIMRTARRAIVQGVGAGDTNIFFLDGYGRAITVLDIKVNKEPSQVGSALEGAIARILPGSAVRVESVTLQDDTNRVVLSGTVLSGDDAERAGQIAIQFAGDPDNVANLVTVVGGQQVMLEVVVAEVRRDVARELGINLSGTLGIGTATIGLNNVGSQVFEPTPFGTPYGRGSSSTQIGNLSIDAHVRALESRGALRLLAQPTLTAMSGKPASFTAGGEIHVWSPPSSDGTRTLERIEYGAQLDFTPTVRSNGSIGLSVKTNISEPQVDGSFSRRNAETAVELPAGSTLAIGGLLDQRTTQQIQQLPGLGNIPILGALFRSREYQSFQTELVILVTPHLVHPTYATPTLPTDRSVPASDAEAIFLGHLEKTYGVGGKGMRGGFSGSVGFVLD